MATQTLLDAHNAYRARHCVPPLTWSPEVAATAQVWANRCVFDHDYHSDFGENLAWGTYQLSTPQAIVAAWIASPGHLANILEAQYKETGIAITPSVPESVAPGATGATYAQEFGVIIP